MGPLVFQDPFFTDRKRVTQVPRLDGRNNPRSQDLGQNFEYRVHSRLGVGIDGIFFFISSPGLHGWKMVGTWLNAAHGGY